MRKKVYKLAMTFLLMSVCVSCAQQTLSPEDGHEIVSSGTKACSLPVEGVAAKVDGKGSPIIPDSLLSQYGVIKLPNELKEGETVADFILKQSGVNKDDEGNIIPVSGKKVTPEDINFIEKLQLNK